MTVKATQKYVRITPRKLREVADLIRGRALPEINDVLTTLNKRGARVINETIRQAVANAVNNMGHNEQQLELKSLMIDVGPVYKRFRAGSRGRAKPYTKRTSHITVELNVSDVAIDASKAPAASVLPAKSAKVKKTVTPEMESGEHVEHVGDSIAPKIAAGHAQRSSMKSEAVIKSRAAAPKNMATRRKTVKKEA